MACYDLDGSRFEPSMGTRGFLFATPIQTNPGVHPASCTRGTGSLSNAHLVPTLSIGRSVPVLPLCAYTGRLRRDLYRSPVPADGIVLCKNVLQLPVYFVGKLNLPK